MKFEFWGKKLSFYIVKFAPYKMDGGFTQYKMDGR